MNKKLSEYSVDIGASIEAIFEKVSFQTGESDHKKWYRLDIIFKDKQGRQIIKRLFEPNDRDHDYKRAYAYCLKQLLENFEKGAWNEIPRAKTYTDFYTSYISKLSKHKGKNVFIKTLPIKNPTKPDEYMADLAIDYISNKPMTYTVLEENQAEDFISVKPSAVKGVGDFNNHF